MLISLCIPCHGRTHDLKQTLPHLIEAISEGFTDTEIVVVDYNSPDDLSEYIASVEYPITYRRYTGRDHYHMAHARNLSVKAASGEHIVILSADIWIAPEFLPYVRKNMPADRKFLYDERYKGVIVCRREEFVAAGGYDERFEFYGPEDRDLHDRLVRRGLRAVAMPTMLEVIRTPNAVKVRGYRLPLSKREMHQRGLAVYRDNTARGALLGNPGLWGLWA